MITLLNDYYKIEHIDVAGDETLFGVTLLPDYCAYAGHFPGNPVSPGVCNIRMIIECAEQIVSRRLFLAYIAKCKFSAVMTPHTTPRLQLRMNLTEVEGVYSVWATIFDDTIIFIDFKGELTAIQ
jgi:3-hydroxyacyl-[acyl-carrier-protein] dehydratase